MEENMFFDSINYCSDQTKQYQTVGTFLGLYPEHQTDTTVVGDNNSDYLFGSKQDYYTHVNKVLSFFNDMPDIINIYRVIDKNNENDICYKWLGEHWTYDKQSAMNFANTFDSNMYILFSAQTTKDNIDWEQTIKNYFYYSSNGDYFDENEITVKDCGEKIVNLKLDKLSKKHNENKD